MVPPAERRREVVGEGHMVEVVVLGAGPEWDDVLERPGEVIAAVRIDGLEEAERDPHVHSEDVKVLGEVAVQQGPEDGACAEDGNFGGMRVFCSESEGGRVFVVNLVNVLVQNTSVQGLVGCFRMFSVDLERGRGEQAYRSSGTCPRTQRRAQPEE